MIYAKLYPSELIESYRRAMRGLYTDVYGPDGNPRADRAGVGGVRVQLLAAGHGHPRVRAPDR